MENTEKSEDFQMTQDEMKRIKDAMKDKKFCDLLMEYANEISDPANKKKYEDEIIAMEKQRGQDVRFLKPQSGFVIKTVRLSDNMKVFLNICTSPEIAEYSTQKVKGREQLFLPHTISPVREDFDKAGKKCVVYDICFNHKAYERSLKEPKFRHALIESAFDSLENRISEKMDRKNKKFPKMKYKGMARPLLLRTEKENNSSKIINNDQLNFPYPEPTCFPSKETPDNANGIQPPSTPNGNISSTNVSENIKYDVEPVTPKYKLIHRGYFDMSEFTSERTSTNSTVPKELVLEIELPLTKSASGLDLDIFEKQLVLKSEKPSYNLDITLPYKVDEDKGKAQYDKSKKMLVVTLPVIKPLEPTNEHPKTDTSTSHPTHCLSTSDSYNNSTNSCTNSNTCPSTTSKTPANQDNAHPQTAQDTCMVTTESKLSSCKTTTNNDTKRNIINDACADHASEKSKEITSANSQDEQPKGDKEITERTDIKQESIVSNGIEVVHSLQAEELENAKFDTKILESLPVNSQLPSYTYDQDDEKVTIFINVPNVKVEHLSIGFTEKQVCLSFPQKPEDEFSPDWNLVIRLDDRFSLNKDECGFEAFSDHFELYLRKKNKEPWSRFFIGVSESELKMELFMTECGASELLEKLKSLNVDQLPRASGEESKEDRTIIEMEGHLEQLLISQDKQRTLELARRQQEEADETSDGDEDIRIPSNHDSRYSSESSDADLKVNLMDLVDDVIDENSLMLSPTSTTTLLTSQNQNQRILLERSLSHEPYCHPRLRSILKRTRSDGASSGCDDTDDDVMYMRARSTTFSSTSGNIYTDSEDQDEDMSGHRRRHKSVSFIEEPTVFEFGTNLSKRQWKKAIWERKQREAYRKKRHAEKFKRDATTTSTDEESKDERTNSTSSIDDSTPDVNDTNDTTNSTSGNAVKTEKKGRKSKKVDKKRNRNNSESRSEEESENINQGGTKKKNKRKKKGKKGANMNFSTTNSGSDSMGSEGKPKTTLNNPLIYELD